jgi:hypothetical protein
MMKSIEQPFPTKETWQPLAVVWFLFIPILDCLHYGQISIVVLFCVVIAFSCQESHPAIAALFIIVGSFIKVHPAFLFFFYLYRRQWKMVQWLLLLGAVLGGTSLIIVGIDNWQRFFELLPEHATQFLHRRDSLSFANILYGITGDSSTTTLMSSILGFLFLGIVLRIYRKKPLLEGATATVACSIWLSTIVWPHSLVLMLPLITITFKESTGYKLQFLRGAYAIADFSEIMLRREIFNLPEWHVLIMKILAISLTLSIFAFFIIEAWRVKS